MVYDSENIVNVYANRFRTEWTNTDLRIRFGEIMFQSKMLKGDAAPKSQRTLIIEERVGLTMTWLTAKELRDELNTLITKYEAANGELVDGVVVSMGSTEPTGTKEPIPEPEAPTESA